MELQDKTIIITGASSGIGAAAALLFAKEGAKVVLGARRSQELAQIAGQINQSNGSAVHLVGDVTEEGYAQALVDLAVSEFGALDGAFNNAGYVGDMVPVNEMDSVNWQKVISTNLDAGFYAAKAQIPAMKTGGAILFTSSFVGYSNAGLPGMAAYAAAKSGLLGLVQSLANDHGPDGIRVNALLPGGTKTAMAGDDPEGHAFIAGLHPLKRMADPKEIAATAMFLLSDRASFVTGAPILADGGVSAHLA